MSALNSLESSLDKVFVGMAPKLPENIKSFLVSIAPWASLATGVLSLLSVYWLWNWANTTSSLADYVNELNKAFGGTTVVADRLTVSIWVGLVVLGVAGVLYLLAFPALKALKKSGWDLLFYALILNLAYSIVLLFSDYTGGSFIGTLIGSILGLWLLFQIRGKYKAK